jgi:hypothetical protein
MSCGIPFCGIDRLGQQHRDRHGADATGNRVMGPATSSASSKATSPDVALVVAGVDDDRSRPDPVTADELRSAHWSHDDVSLANGWVEVHGLGVTDRHRRVSNEKHSGYRPTEDRAPADHDRMCTGEQDPVGVQQANDAARSARGEAWEAERHGGIELHRDAVNVLFGRDRLEDSSLIDVAGTGGCTRTPSTSEASDSARTALTASSVVMSAPSFTRLDSMPTYAERLCFMRR